MRAWPGSRLAGTVAVLAAIWTATWTAACARSAPPLSGLWDATVEVSGVSIPFRLELADDGSHTKGWFFDGEQKIASSDDRSRSGRVDLSFPQYATRLEATRQADGTLQGAYHRSGATAKPYPFRAHRSSPDPPQTETAPTIAGVWTIPTKSSKGESAWRFIVRQSGNRVSGAILRVDGDTGTLSGSYINGRFVMSHFSGVRPLLLEVTRADDGTLQILQNGRVKLSAVRADDSRAGSLPTPTDPARHTTMKDAGAPFTFEFPDLSGRLVSERDSRLAGKVVLVNIMGSWCPNCHDEAPFLSELYQRYRSLGLEVVALSFEEAEQLRDPIRLRAFIARYAIEYTVLLAGVPDEASAKIPQAVNLNAFPTTFFLGRDGRVRRVHAGFASAASGEFHTQDKTAFTSLVEALLAEQRPES